MYSKFLIVLFLLFSFSSFAQNNKSHPKFDPNRDPFEDLKITIEKAEQSDKRIILDVGGEWCIWCHRIDAFMQNTDEVKSLLEENYILLKVNFSKENKNEKFLSNYPSIDGYPHFFVLEKDGTLLHSQNTGELEKDKDYSKEKFVEFLDKWKPKKN
ncbi:MAG: thioredoxin family protein [Ignavibacteriota bacterium]|jgi:thioredoxin-related protein|nr:thioredoxin family protein [Ignavibacterium album]MCZ2267547.1 thioredoxin family protein [Ignavibacteriales bacterium]MDD5609035.1 thioredoxin family protein [Ignavibacterium sp.]MDX9711750.1 thioredoxin family protein [Ignavibacteriaceae bacterium]QKK00511.1 MAG: thioredoxin family protein [Ignavibacteriota bacterium]